MSWDFPTSLYLPRQFERIVAKHNMGDTVEYM